MSLTVVGDWLAQAVPKCTCGDGRSPYGHEPGCGYEPVATISEVREAFKAAGMTVIDTETLSTALNFGYGKEPTPEGAIARANLREQLS